jgi:hypothetical protein
LHVTAKRRGTGNARINKRVSKNPLFNDFYLVGGTALALQLG